MYDDYCTFYSSLTQKLLDQISPPNFYQM